MRLVLLGNAGSGKSTMARKLTGSADIRCLSLNEIALEREYTSTAQYEGSV